MLNLDERYHSYLSGSKRLRIDGAEEKVKAYGYTDNGSDIIGYYLIVLDMIGYYLICLDMI